MTTWFISDTHFGHANIIKYCRRPFNDTTHMDGAMIAAWNAVVAPDDDIWHLGDFSFGSAHLGQGYLERLTGRKHLIWGNHDSEDVRTAPGWTSTQAMAEITVNRTKIVLLHYAMRVWPGSHKGALHFYGHTHGKLPGDRQSCDVGVDAWNFRPVTLSDIQRRLASLAPHIDAPMKEPQ
jgi:calcineurin-like phosphoesterase family protein